MTSNQSFFEVINAPFVKKIEVPTSKSYANRILTLSAISDEEIKVKNLPHSTDVLTLINCLMEIGLEIKREADSLLISNCFPACEQSKNPLRLKTGDGGTTNRFLIPLLALGENEYEIVPDGLISQRPIDELVKHLQKLDVKIEFNNSAYWLKVQGPLRKQTEIIEVDCSKTTQIASSLLMVLSKLNIEVEANNIKSSQTYFQLTKYLIEQFKKNQTEFTVPVDFSSASYPIALAVITGECIIDNCNKIDSYQSDSVFVELLNNSGANIKIDNSGLIVRQSKTLTPMDVDCSPCPDLVPALAFVCSYISGTSYLRNLSVLRFKESDRVEEIIKVLTKFNVKFEADQENETLIIHGNNNAEKIEFTQYLPPKDHRIIMMTYLFMRRNSGGKLFNFQHAEKSFPDFFGVMS